MGIEYTFAVFVAFEQLHSTMLVIEGPLVDLGGVLLGVVFLGCG
jgi:hypothetical protein